MPRKGKEVETMYLTKYLWQLHLGIRKDKVILRIFMQLNKWGRSETIL